MIWTFTKASVVSQCTQGFLLLLGVGAFLGIRKRTKTIFEMMKLGIKGQQLVCGLAERLSMNTKFMICNTLTKDSYVSYH